MSPCPPIEALQLSEASAIGCSKSLLRFRKGGGESVGVGPIGILQSIVLVVFATENLPASARFGAIYRLRLIA